MYTSRLTSIKLKTRCGVMRRSAAQRTSYPLCVKKNSSIKFKCDVNSFQIVIATQVKFQLVQVILQHHAEPRKKKAFTNVVPNVWRSSCKNGMRDCRDGTAVNLSSTLGSALDDCANNVTSSVNITTSAWSKIRKSTTTR